MNNDAFLNIIDSTPLVSIDIILERSDGLFLVGKRVNKPAEGYWFVPGGAHSQKRDPTNRNATNFKYRTGF
ncbi:hypothetical protein [Marinomonas mediterranea]|uniref:hypothetical protein n=1 Tax=Marinomonas mediterranea TaxID=119864 RepID=UPI0023493DE6|nr:hypothetical protein [Marinomonas mediterranea]